MKSYYSISVLALVLAGCTRQEAPHLSGNSSHLAQPKPIETLKASFYGKGDGLAGEKTASGEIFDPQELTAAHRTYAFGTLLKVTSQATGKSVQVRINDRGPFAEGRSLDLSHRAAEELGLTGEGVADVTVEVLER